jgi:hypothetical protein
MGQECGRGGIMYVIKSGNPGLDQEPQDRSGFRVGVQWLSTAASRPGPGEISDQDGGRDSCGGGTGSRSQHVSNLRACFFFWSLFRDGKSPGDMQSATSCGGS